MTTPRWVELAALADIPADRPKTIKIDGHQLAVFRIPGRDGDRVYAVDNRCPHEGYPLASGTVANGVLTCEWHNWKFELDCGRCILGGEDVRAYPLRRDGDRVWIDLAPPPDQTETLYASLFGAFDEADWGWVARVLERLLAAGESGVAILDRVVARAAARVPYGFDHGLATAADLAALLDGSDADGARLLDACQAMIQPNLRRPPVPASAPAADPSEAELRRRIEAEDTAGAEAQVRGALADASVERIDQVAGWLSRAASDHFVDYGHGEIYAVKARELAGRLGPGAGATGLLVALARSLCLGTREDRLPYMRRFSALLAPRLARLRWPDADADLDDDALIAAAVDGDLEAALGAVDAALDAGAAPPRIGLALAIAAGHRLARFDHRLEADPAIGHGWLDVTHLLTHADAVIEACRRWPSTDALRGLYHAARFVQHAAPLDHPEPPPLPPEPTADALWRAAFAGGVAPIFFAHRIKASAAALRLTAAIRADRQLGARADAGVPLRAVARFLAAAIDERRTASRATAARLFVRDGKRLKTRLGY